MNKPNPAIVAQDAVRRLPRAVLWLFCLAYVLPGFFGRAPWKSADMTALGYMAELANSHLNSLSTEAWGFANWLTPQLLGLAPKDDALLPYWLGAWAMQLAPNWVATDFAARIPFVLMQLLALLATWYGIYYLARADRAQPVAFAFGGEARPADYARAIADAGVLAFIACLGLAQLSHETTSAAAQLCFTALVFYAWAATPFRTVSALVCSVVGLGGLSLSGAPALAVLFGLGGLLEKLLSLRKAVPSYKGSFSDSFSANFDDRASVGGTSSRRLVLPKSAWIVIILALTAACAALAFHLDLWRWRVQWPKGPWHDAQAWREWHGLGRLFLWFLWPAWPLALWTAWRWRRQLFSGLVAGNSSRHLLLPLWFVIVAFANTILTQQGDRALLLALPAMAALAAFALPTLSRGLGALVDWFTLLFFTGCAIVVWVVWIAMQTGFPPQPAANVVRLAPGFSPSFAVLPFVVAVCATLAWGWLVHWRAGRHRAAIWKTLVLPAGGAALCWLLLMTLWLPLLDFARSYTLLVHRIGEVVKTPVCLEAHGLDRGQIAAFRVHGPFKLLRAGAVPMCPWLLVDRDAVASLPLTVNMRLWTPQYVAFRPSDSDDDVVLYRLREPSELARLKPPGRYPQSAPPTKK